jgi:hypothetical protein
MCENRKMRPAETVPGREERDAEQYIFLNLQTLESTLKVQEITHRSKKKP